MNERADAVNSLLMEYCSAATIATKALHAGGWLMSEATRWARTHLWLLTLVGMLAAACGPESGDAATLRASLILSPDGPIITAISPNAEIQEGKRVSIQGMNFGPDSVVSFNGTPAVTIYYYNSKLIKAVVPAGATSGPVSVTSGGVTGESPSRFGVLARIRHFIPKTVYRGAPLTLSGTGFTDTTSVLFGGISAPFVVVDDTTITTIFPSSANSGLVTIVKPEGNSNSSTSFARLAGLQAFSPTSAGRGDTVTVTGGGFTGATTVRIGSTPAEYTVVDDGTITVTVPTEFATTRGRISIDTPNGNFESRLFLWVSNTPTLSSFAPTRARLPAEVMLNGANLLGTTSVTVGGVPVPFLVTNAARITISMPAGTPSGQIAITNPAGDVTSADSFSVLDLCAGVLCFGIDDCHEAGTCNPVDGRCSIGEPKANGSSCSDGNACTQLDYCQYGSCVGFYPVYCGQGACVSYGGTPSCSCDSGYDNCRGAACETDILGSASNCGACGITCEAGESCNGGVCTAVSSALPTEGMAAHYDASDRASVTLSGDRVVRWADISGNGRHLNAMGAPPVYQEGAFRGLPALDFGGVQPLVSDAFPLDASVTVFAVMQHRSPSAWGAIAHHGNRDFDWSLENNAFHGPNAMHFQSNNDNGGVELQLQGGMFYVLAGRVSGSMRYLSATSQAGTIASMGGGVTIEPRHAQLFVGTSDAMERSNALIAELVYYSRPLSDGERDQVIASLRQKWRL